MRYGPIGTGASCSHGLRRWWLTALCGLAIVIVQGNNIAVSGLAFPELDPVAGTVQVRFDITWENSWRTSSAPNNWDAAWVFVKFRDANTGAWQHARLGSDAEHVAPPGSTIATGLLTPGAPYDANTNWGIGVFIYRSADGTGTFVASGVELRWNYALNGIGCEEIADVKVFAVEMVHVPTGTFTVGSGSSTETNRFKNGPGDGTFPIPSEDELILGNVAGQLWADGAIQAATLPAAFPKGYAAFYLMKYEVSQQQYVDFLNALTRVQQNTRTQTGLAVGVTNVTNRYVMRNATGVGNRQGIRCDAVIDANAPINFYCDLNGNGIGGEASDGLWLACNFLNWDDLFAYLDWSGLRPMTELEFEKACRGPLPGANAYAWGTTSVTAATSIINPGAINETLLPANANATTADQPSVQGPVRAGAFATGASTRAQSGASYYGAMQMSDNLFERLITLAVATGRNFDGRTGDGSLSATGTANVPNWPAGSGAGAGFRGGAYNSATGNMRISDRANANPLPTATRSAPTGGRGVRQAP